jgi:SM-20-related protein
MNSYTDDPTMLVQSFPWERVKHDLERQAWSLIPSLLPKQQLDAALSIVERKCKKDQFYQAKVGKDLNKSLRKHIRNSDISWVENSELGHDLSSVHHFYVYLMQEFNQYFYLSLKRWESQLAYYPQGGFYKKHLDQLRENKHRQLTCIFFLQDCLQGGELVLYQRENKAQIDAIVPSRAGSCVLFFSGEIYHQVLPTFSERISLTTWFRDDLVTVIS